MEISVRVTDNVVLQFGHSLGEREGCSIETVDDALLDQLHQSGIKTLQADGSLTVTPAPEYSIPDDRTAAVETLKAHLPAEAHEALDVLFRSA